MSGIKQLIAAGLVATASATNLRSEQSLSNSAVRSEIDALAKKYNCADGTKSLEEIITEITKKNGEETVALNQQCASDLASYVTDMNSAILAANNKEAQDKVEAEATRARQDDAETLKHNNLVTLHEGLTATAQTNADKAKSEYETQYGLYHGKGGQKSVYDVEHALLIVNRQSALDEFNGAISDAADALTNGKASEDGIRNTAITAANAVKVEDDAICVSTLAGRNAIVKADSEIISELKGLEQELEKVKNQERDTSVIKNAALLETANTLRASVHAIYATLATAKANERADWAQTCADAQTSYDGELSKKNSEAQHLRDTTVGIHDGVYDTEKAAHDAATKVIVDNHNDLVTAATNKASAALQDFTEKNTDWKAKAVNLVTVTSKVAGERKEARSFAVIERAQFEAEKTRIIAEANRFMTETIKHADALMVEEKGICNAANNKRKGFLSGDQKVIDDLEPLLAKLDRCNGKDPLSLLEVGTKMNAECAMNELNLLEIFNAKSPEHKRTTGSFVEWKKRLAAETADSQRINDECEAKAQGAFDATKKAAEDLQARQQTKAENDARVAIQQVDDELANTESNLDDEFAAAKIPHDLAQSLNDAAEIVKDDTATAQSVAEDRQREEVATARSINKHKTEVSENKRTNNIQTDRDTATKIDADAKADHEHKSSTQKARCEAEDLALQQEAKALDSVIAKMQQLQHANKGMTFNDVDDLKKDIENMESNLADETASAKKDNEVCHDDATALQTKDTLAANNAYTAAEKVLQSTHDAAKKLATDNKSNSDAEHTQRENTNESNYEAATTLFNTKQKNNVDMAQALKVAEGVEADEVGDSKSNLDQTRTRLQAEKDATVATKEAEAKQTRDQATSHELAQRTAKNKVCLDENSLLQAEKETLALTMTQIDSLVTVADNKIGAAADRAQ